MEPYTPEELYRIAKDYCKKMKYFNADDLIQEFVIAGWKAGLNNERPTVRTYQYIKGVSKILAVLVSRKRDAARLEKHKIIAEKKTQPTPFEIVSESEIETRLDELIRGELTGDKLTIYELRLAGLTVEEIANKLSKTQQAIFYHLSTMNKAINKAIKETK